MKCFTFRRVNCNTFAGNLDAFLSKLTYKKKEKIFKYDFTLLQELLGTQCLSNYVERIQVMIIEKQMQA